MSCTVRKRPRPDDGKTREKKGGDPMDHRHQHGSREEEEEECSSNSTDGLINLCCQVTGSLKKFIEHIEETDPELLSPELNEALKNLNTFKGRLLGRKGTRELSRGGSGIDSPAPSPSSDRQSRSSDDYTPSKSPLLQQIIRHSIDFRMAKLEDFSVGEKIGKGMFANVHICRHKPTGRYFAIKVLNKAKIVRFKQTTHLRNERSILYSLNHPFVVKLYGTFKDRFNLYMLMEYVPGGELFDYIRRSSGLCEATCKYYTAQLVLALEYLHSNHVLHRDLKPENLLLDANGHIKVVDFGLAKRSRERTYSVCGTDKYMAPEMVVQTGHTMGVDWWSLGILLYEMLVGCPPFNSDPNRSIFEKILSGDVEMPQHVSREGQHLIKKLISVSQKERFGCGPNGAEEIKQHKWFEGIDWGSLGKGKGPLNPKVTEEGDIHNYHLSNFFDTTVHEPQEPGIDYDKLFEDF